MRARTLHPFGVATAVVALVAGCQGEQRWTFTNGVGLGDMPPARIVAEVHEGAECGFACRPPGRRVYCAEVEAGARGPAPEGLEAGTDYCFVGLALDAAGRPIALGCAAAPAGDEDPIEVVLSPVDEAVPRAVQCDPQGVMDAGSRDAGTPLDSGPPADTGPGDAGSDGGLDAGSPDAGPQVVVLRVRILPPGGGAMVTSIASGTTWIVPGRDGAIVNFDVQTIAGRPFRVRSDPDVGYAFERFEGGGCGATDPCELVLEGNTMVDVHYAPSGG